MSAHPSEMANEKWKMENLFVGSTSLSGSNPGGRVREVRYVWVLQLRCDEIARLMTLSLSNIATSIVREARQQPH
jgi:hypothetical protein